MRTDLTDITLVSDRSGSMSVIKSDAEGGINSFIKEQAALPGDAYLTLVQFDTQYDFVHRGANIKDVPPYTLRPRGGTALFDAVGRAIVETGERLNAMPEADRPALVVFVVSTDGQENSSREYTQTKVREMIEHQQNVYHWKFIFLGANQDAFAEAGAIGIGPIGTANFVPQKTAAAYKNTHANVARMRSAVAGGQSAKSVKPEYTDEERRSMNP